jgi:hypothetical protein
MSVNTPDDNKTLRVLIATIGAVLVLCGWGFVLWQLRG